MRHLALTAMILMVLLVATGCSSYQAVLPQQQVPLADLSTTSSYEILGPAVGTASGGVLFWVIPVGRENKAATLVSPGGTVFAASLMSSGRYYSDPIISAAIYNAIESFETADALVAPRVSIVSNNYLIYSQKTATVKGKVIRLVP